MDKNQIAESGRLLQAFHTARDRGDIKAAESIAECLSRSSRSRKPRREWKLHEKPILHLRPEYRH